MHAVQAIYEEAGLRGQNYQMPLVSLSSIVPGSSEFNSYNGQKKFKRNCISVFKLSTLWVI